jgi:hypothetical protein
MNSIFDPDLTGVGHQPQLHDQLALLYSKYLVMSCSYKITFTDPSAKDWSVGLLKYDNSESFSLADYIINLSEKRNCVRFATFPSEAGSLIFQGRIDNWKYRDMGADRYFNNTHYEASFGANPTTENYLTLMAETLANDTSTVLKATVELVFHGYAFYPLAVAQS